jgi:hypothetical protein
MFTFEQRQVFEFALGLIIRNTSAYVVAGNPRCVPRGIQKYHTGHMLADISYICTVGGSSLGIIDTSMIPILQILRNLIYHQDNPMEIVWYQSVFMFPIYPPQNTWHPYDFPEWRWIEATAQ